MRNLVEFNEKEPIFEILFLKNDEEKYVEVWETNCIVFDDLINHLRSGESVFINPKEHNRQNLSRRLDKKSRKPVYFKRI